MVEQRSYLYNVPGEIEAVRGDGIFLFDSEGHSYIDLGAGTFNLSLGYGHPAIVEAMAKQAQELVHASSSFRNEQIERLAQRLVALSPKSIALAHLKVSSGSVANEGAIKMAQRATGNSGVVTLFRSHLGQTAAMTSLSGNAFRKKELRLRVANGLQIPDPYCLRCFYAQRPETCGLLCAERLTDFLEFATWGDVAAVVIEPISGNGGNIVCPPGYLSTIQTICRANGIKLILDEIQTGIGRTGYMFASEHFGLEPDAITVAKGLGGSGAQIAAILASDDMSGLPATEHSFTYGANILAAAAANATLDIISEPSFLAHVRQVGEYIMQTLPAALERAEPYVADVRGLGLMIGVEIQDELGQPDSDLTTFIAAEAPRFGLIVRTSRYGRGNVLKIRPPLILSMVQAADVVERFSDLVSTCAESWRRRHAS